MHTPWKQRLKSWMVPQAGGVDSLQDKIAAGLYHYQFHRDDGYIRFHLRVERSGESLLIAGASEAVHISRDGTPVIKRLLEGESRETLASELPTAAEPWIAQGVQILKELGSPSSRFPVFNLSDPVDDPRDAELIAPFQADVELDEAKAFAFDSAKDVGRWYSPCTILADDSNIRLIDWCKQSNGPRTWA